MARTMTARDLLELSDIVAEMLAEGQMRPDTPVYIATQPDHPLLAAVHSYAVVRHDTQMVPVLTESPWTTTHMSEEVRGQLEEDADWRAQR